MFSRIAVKLPAVMPLPNRIDAHSGSAPCTPGTNVTNIAMPRLVLTMTMLRWSLKSTLASDWMPTTATVANNASAAPPSTECGIPATIAAVFGSTPRMIMIPPAAAITQRLFTWVSRTSPTFSEKQV